MSVPSPTAVFPEALLRIEKLGVWLRENGNGIYSSHIYTPYRTGSFAFTRGKDGVVYLIRLYEQDEYVQQEICVLCAGMAKSAALSEKASGWVVPLPFTQPEKGVSYMTPEEQLGNNPITHLFILAG